MRTRFLASLFAAALTVGVRSAGLRASGKPGQWVEPPKKLPHVRRGDRTHNLDFLFGALKAAPDEETAKAVEQRIWALWMVSRSDTANLLMTRVQTAVEDKDLDLALKLLDAIVKIKPDYVEAWNRRATIYYMKKDYGRALADIREVLEARAAPFRRADRPRPDPAGHRRRQAARWKSIAARWRSIRACSASPTW